MLGDGTGGLATLLRRAAALDADASARWQAVGEGALDVYVTTPFDCLAARRVRGRAARDGAAVRAKTLLNAIEAGGALAPAEPGEPVRLEVGPVSDASWPGALPPASGFTERDTIPVGVASRLADEGRALARQFSGPAGPPRSLLDSTVITGDTESGNPVDIPMRMVFACTSLGLIPGFEAPAGVPRHLRVSTRGRWVRLDAPFGSVYRNSGLGLLF